VRGDEGEGAANGRPDRDTDGHFWIALVVDLTQPATLGVHDPQVGMTAAVGEKRDLFAIRAGRGGKNLSGLSRYTNTVTHVISG